MEKKKTIYYELWHNGRNVASFIDLVEVLAWEGKALVKGRYENISAKDCDVYLVTKDKIQINHDIRLVYVHFTYKSAYGDSYIEKKGYESVEFYDTEVVDNESIIKKLLTTHDGIVSIDKVEQLFSFKNGVPYNYQKPQL